MNILYVEGDPVAAAFSLMELDKVLSRDDKIVHVESPAAAAKAKKKEGPFDLVISCYKFGDETVLEDMGGVEIYRLFSGETTPCFLSGQSGGDIPKALRKRNPEVPEDFKDRIFQKPSAISDIVENFKKNPIPFKTAIRPLKKEKNPKTSARRDI